MHHSGQSEPHHLIHKKLSDDWSVQIPWYSFCGLVLYEWEYFMLPIHITYFLDWICQTFPALLGHRATVKLIKDLNWTHFYKKWAKLFIRIGWFFLLLTHRHYICCSLEFLAQSVYNQDDSHGDDGKPYVHNEYDGNDTTMAIMAIKARMKRIIFLAKRRSGSDGKTLSE